MFDYDSLNKKLDLLKEQSKDPNIWQKQDAKIIFKEIKITENKISDFYKLENNMFSPSPYYMYARSSIYKTPFMLANNVGIIDSGYRGNLGIALYNHTQHSEEVKSGTRLTQICMPDLSPNFHVLLVNKLDDTERGQGGFGSTGT